jgi:hypothetical protein
MTFTRSTDYAAIKALLSEPRCWRRMHGGPVQAIEVGPREGTEYVTATENGKLVGVFVILHGIEVHFCFIPAAWGSTLEISKAFLDWAWANLDTPVLIGPIPARNRLALRLAKLAGFCISNYTDRADLIYSYIRRPEVAA